MKVRSQPDTFERVGARLAPLVDVYKAAGKRWDSAVAQWLGRQSVADWMASSQLDAGLAAGLRGLRGFFLADPEDLSLLQLVDQFASDEIPGEAKVYRLRDGNDALPAALAASLRGRVILGTAVTRIARRGSVLRIGDGRRAGAAGERRLCRDGAAGNDAAQGHLHAGAARAAAARDRRPAVRPGDSRPAAVRAAVLEAGSAARPAFGSDQPTGAVWDGNEQQPGRAGILSLLAGGNAARDVRTLIRDQGWPGLVRRLSWLGRPSRLLDATTIAWDRDPWVRGGYAVFDPDVRPRPARLARAPRRPHRLCRRAHQRSVAGLYERRDRNRQARRPRNRGDRGSSDTRQIV